MFVNASAFCDKAVMPRALLERPQKNNARPQKVKTFTCSSSQGGLHLGDMEGKVPEEEEDGS